MIPGKFIVVKDFSIDNACSKRKCWETVHLKKSNVYKFEETLSRSIVWRSLNKLNDKSNKFEEYLQLDNEEDLDNIFTILVREGKIIILSELEQQ
jgi:penicillin V acylase-like amidase (Ntn superfamily)